MMAARRPRKRTSARGLATFSARRGRTRHGSMITCSARTTTMLTGDRQAAKRLLRAVPGARQAALDNRAFVGRMVRHLARQGITQFLDIGSGLPTTPSVHELAWQVAPVARVVYADNDPVVAAYARALPAARA